MITEKIGKFVSQQKLGFVATVSPNDTYNNIDTFDDLESAKALLARSFDKYRYLLDDIS